MALAKSVAMRCLVHPPDPPPPPAPAQKMLNPLELSRLIGLVYDAAAQPGLWPQVLALSAQMLEAAPGTGVDRGDAAAHAETDPATLLGLGLLPHLTRAFAWRQELDDALGQRDALAAVLDRLPLAMALVDAQGKVSSMNQAMLSLTRSSQRLAVLQGHLVSRPASALRDGLAQVLGTGLPRAVPSTRYKGLPSDQALTLGTSADDDGVSLWLAPLPSVQGPASMDGPRPAMAVVMAASRRSSRALSAPALASLFGLSPAEARLAQQIALGQPMDEACTALAISGNTGKTHLKRIFSKMGVRRQSELVQAIYASPLWLTPTPGEVLADAQALPAADSGRLRLRDGRWLSYSDVGARDGLPLLLMHAYGGARYTRHPDDSLLLAAGIRLIVPDRPGCGDADPQPGRKLADWPLDMAALLDHLGLDRFAVLGFSAGTPYALSLALAMPTRVLALGLAAPIVPIDHLTDLRHYAGSARLPLWLAGHAAGLLPTAMRGAVQQVRSNVHRYIEMQMAQSTTLDRQAFEDPRLRAAYVQGLLANLRRGPDDMADDLRVAFSNWGLDLARLSLPVQLWHGDGDRVVTLAGARQLASRLPSAQLQVLPGGGHFLIYSHWPLLLDGMRELAGWTGNTGRVRLRA